MRFAFCPSSAVLTPPLLLCYALCGTVFAAAVLLNTVLPFHLIDRGGSRTQIGLLFSLTTIVSMVLRPAVGSWIDRVGARPVLLLGIAIFAAVSLTLHVPQDPGVVIAVMAAIGLGNALINTANTVLTARAIDATHRGEALSLYYLASSLGIAVAPPAALALRAWGGMSIVFAGVTGLSLLLFALALSFPRALTEEVTGARPRFRVFSRHAVGVSGALVLTTIGYSSTYAFLPLYATSRGQGSTVVWFFAMYSVSLIACRALFGALSDRVGRVRVALPAMILTAAGYFTLTISLSPASLVVAAGLLGSGGGILYPTLVALVLDRTPEVERGVALGTVKSAWDLGVVVGSALLGFVADRVSFEAGFALAGAAAALGALAFVGIENRQPRALAHRHAHGVTREEGLLEPVHDRRSASTTTTWDLSLRMRQQVSR